ncbi:MAG TPA: hypothetical protein VGG11_03895 [Xanthobacteraceae bacterium]|jgi:hypothetical protein
MKALTPIVLPILIAASAAAAQSGSYSGNWPVKVRLPPHFGNTDCLTLTDNGTDGSPHSGPVSSTGDIAPGLTGTFQVVRGLLVVNLEDASEGQVTYLSFIAPARDGQITGKGVFNDPGFFAVAPLTFGENGGC